MITAYVMFAIFNALLLLLPKTIDAVLGQFTGVNAEFILHVIATIGLIPANIWCGWIGSPEQVFYPCSAQKENAFSGLMILTARAASNSYAIIKVMTNCVTG